MKKYALLISLIIYMPALWADASVTGLWKTIDDETGKAKSIVEIWIVDGKLQGKIVDLLLKPDDTLCKECKGDLHMQPVVGMQILTDLEKDDDQYSGGEILDPANGKTYGCKLWLDEGQLKVRGYLGFFFRTQTWYRAESAEKELPTAP
ncbi:MAG: DUF2147 domain-containing protein [Pseudomonadales bacterium]|nr:DUF2147 domain-containing protein [Pseudomonadales bacterium]